jgi:hypothetical protein
MLTGLKYTKKLIGAKERPMPDDRYTTTWKVGITPEDKCFEKSSNTIKLDSQSKRMKNQAQATIDRVKRLDAEHAKKRELQRIKQQRRIEELNRQHEQHKAKIVQQENTFRKDCYSNLHTAEKIAYIISAIILVVLYVLFIAPALLFLKALTKKSPKEASYFLVTRSMIDPFNLFDIFF